MYLLHEVVPTTSPVHKKASASPSSSTSIRMHALRSPSLPTQQPDACRILAARLNVAIQSFSEQSPETAPINQLITVILTNAAASSFTPNHHSKHLLHL